MLYVPLPLNAVGSAAVAAAFTPAVKAALLAGIAQALGIDVSGVFIASITPYTYRRRRSLYLQPSAGTGVSVSTGILASAAASSPLVMAALGGGAADTIAVLAATVTVVKAQMSSGALAAAVAAQPAIVLGLGYSSSAQLVAQLSLDGTPAARAPPVPAPLPSSGGGVNTGLVSAIVLLLLAVCGAAGYFFSRRARLRALKEYQSQHPHPPVTMTAAASQRADFLAPQPKVVASNDPRAATNLPMTAANVMVQKKALSRAEEELHATAEEIARARTQLEAQERAFEHRKAQVLTEAQDLERAVAAKSAAAMSEIRHSSEVSAPPLPGQVAVAGTGAGSGMGVESSFAGPSSAQLRSGLSNEDFVLDEDVNRFLDKHGLVDVLGQKTSCAPLLVDSLAEVCAEDGRRFVPLATRRLALLGFIASRKTTAAAAVRA